MSSWSFSGGTFLWSGQKGAQVCHRWYISFSFIREGPFWPKVSSHPHSGPQKITPHPDLGLEKVSSHPHLGPHVTSSSRPTKDGRLAAWSGIPPEDDARDDHYKYGDGDEDDDDIEKEEEDFDYWDIAK